MNDPLSYQASHDALTGLLNRREFERRLKQAIESAHVGGQHQVLFYVDIDRFRAVNEECGHMAGDSVLREVAALIKEVVPNSSNVGRLGGDQFGILVMDCSLEQARQIADDVARTVADHRFVWKDRTFHIGVSTGVVEISRESRSPEDVMRAAQSACYVAKQQGSRLQVYSAREEAEAHQRGEIDALQRLQAALKDGRLELHARPIISLDGSKTHGPALAVQLNLKDENGATIGQDDFMRAAGRHRLLPHVDRWVVQTALAALHRGAVRLPHGRSLFISLSWQALRDATFLDFVVDCFDRTGVAPDQVCFGLQESSVISVDEHGRRFIGVLHGMGCQFGIADFDRSGVSSFSHLKNLPLDCVMIDGAPLRDIASDAASQAMVAAMIKLARSLGIQILVVEQGEVVAIAIDWEVGGEMVLRLMVHADGSVQRMGTAAPSCEDHALYCGSSEEALLPGILARADLELFDQQGLTVLEPISGKLCKLAVHLWREHGGSQAFEVWYGSGSAGPSLAITAFVANAIERTNPWYAWMQKKQRAT